VLITFSALVGSGKSTHAKNVVRLLSGLGYAPYLIHFRQIGWRHLFMTRSLEPEQVTTTASQRKRGRNRSPITHVRYLQTQKRLRFTMLLGYLTYILRFRLFVLLHHRRHLLVLNRYFYDNFAHFRVASKLDRVYLRLLLWAVPKPDLAFLLFLSPESAHRRRPTYSYETLRMMARNYRRLCNFINHATVVITDEVRVDFHR
jgi:thymidylate kinase